LAETTPLKGFVAAPEAKINASFITGLADSYQIAILDDKLCVTNGFAGTVGEYNAKTGAVMNAAFISGITAEIVGVAVRP
jgi:hypothetical protein